ncbi:CobW: cobalamin biosynthesis protein CobW [compost metagenome]
MAERSTRRVNMVSASFGKLGADVLLGLGVGTEDDIANRKSHHEIHHADGHEHDHDEFESFVVEAGSVADPKAFTEKLMAVIAEHDVLRLKGFVDVPGKPMRLVVQAVGPRIEHYFDRPWGKDEVRNTRLVVIGLHEIDEQAITKAVKDAVS